jgi:hypothetical protein
MGKGFYLPPEIGELKDTLIDVCVDLSDFTYTGIETLDELQRILPNAELH